MTLPRLLSLRVYQTRWPALHKMVATHLGYEEPKKESAEQNLEAFMAESIALTRGP